MADECIHGLEPGLCDSCSPQPEPEPVRPAVGASARRPARAGGTARPEARPPSVRPPGGPAVPRVEVARHRVVHVTHLDNLPGILAAGALLVAPEPVRDVSSAVTRELRRSAPYPRVAADAAAAGTDRSIADAVTFSLVPDSARWRELRAGASGPAWSDAARASRPTDFVALVATIGALVELHAGTVLADGDAAASRTRFASAGDRPDATRLLTRLGAADDGLAVGELLVPTDVPLTSLVLIGVPNDPVRDRVRQALDAVGAELRLAVHPPWFAAVP